MNIAYIPALYNLLESIHVEISKWLLKNLPLQEIQIKITKKWFSGKYVSGE